jgi:hypothetical protein
MASVNKNTEAGTTAWQWQMVAVFLMLNHWHCYLFPKGYCSLVGG